MCDVVYDVLRDRVERQALASVQLYAIYDSSGRYEMRDEAPTVESLLAQYDAALEAEPAEADPDHELLQLMGVA